MNELNELNEIFVRGNHNIKDKIKKRKINRLKRLKHCSGNMTPSVSTENGRIKVTCTPKDRIRARIQKRTMRKRKANRGQFKKSLARTQDTKKFRHN